MYDCYRFSDRLNLGSNPGNQPLHRLNHMKHGTKSGCSLCAEDWMVLWDETMNMRSVEGSGCFLTNGSLVGYGQTNGFVLLYMRF